MFFFFSLLKAECSGSRADNLRLLGGEFNKNKVLIFAEKGRFYCHLCRCVTCNLQPTWRWQVECIICSKDYAIFCTNRYLVTLFTLAIKVLIFLLSRRFAHVVQCLVICSRDELNYENRLPPKLKHSQLVFAKGYHSLNMYEFWYVVIHLHMLVFHCFGRWGTCK